MKNLNTIELNQIAGGEKFLAVTSTLELEGISNCCKLSFLNNQTNLDNLVGHTQADLKDMIYNECTNLRPDPQVFTNVTKFKVIDQ